VQKSIVVYFLHVVVAVKTLVVAVIDGDDLRRAQGGEHAFKKILSSCEVEKIGSSLSFLRRGGRKQRRCVVLRGIFQSGAGWLYA
jgi:hypothetical protein